MRRGAQVVGLAVAVGLAAGCAGGGGFSNLPAGTAQEAAATMPASAHALVLQQKELAGDHGESLLQAMQANLPAVRVSGTSGCPDVALRGPNPLPGVSEPTVYLDGARATNTCVLSDLPADQVARVEVYPQGFTPRPGYAPNASGLILVFSRSAQDDLGDAALQQ